MDAKDFGMESKQSENKFTPSIYQQNIYGWVKTGTGSAIIEAVAGSGKTTTIVDALNHIPGNKKVIFLAFNKDIAEELKTRVPSHVTASTFHSAGFRTWLRRYPNAKLDDRKISKIVRNLISWDEFQGYGKYVVDIVGLAKQGGMGKLIPDMYTVWRDIADYFDVRIDDPGLDYNKTEMKAIRLASEVLQASIDRSEHEIDFNDMIYMPIRMDLMPFQYDWVFIDESQDTNKVRRELAKKMVKPGGRLVAVGDSNQAIYGFTGADSDAMSIIKEEMACVEFPLSVSYRCSKAVVSRAKQYVMHIEWSENAPEGYVGHTTIKQTPPGKNDAILCRNTAPLVGLAFKLIGNGTACKVLGREIGQSLIKMIEKLNSVDIPGLEKDLTDFFNEESERLINRGHEEKVQALEDKVTCIRTIIDNLPGVKKTISDLLIQIDSLFGDSVSGILTLSTVHKAKGLEWNNVYIYMPELMPSKWAKQEWQMVQEKNLQYVAITRAKINLYYLSQI